MSVKLWPNAATAAALALALIATFAVVALMASSGAQPAYATYPGKNGLIANAIDRGNGQQLYTIRPVGADLTPLTSVDGNAWDPDWSPDGTKIVFGVDPPGGEPLPYGCRIKFMNAGGSNITDITPRPIVAHRGCAYNPSFTPDGKRIVFVGLRCHDEIKCPRKIRSMNLHGRNRRLIGPALRDLPRHLPPGGYDLHAPRVSPDGSTVVFTVVNENHVVVQGEPGNRKALYTVRMNSTHLRQIVPFRSDVCTCGGDWAPNGRRIVSSDQVGPTPVPGASSNLFTVRPDGTGLRHLTHYRKSSPDVIVGAGTYSPDGRWIVFKHANDPERRYVLWKIHPDGTHLTRIRGMKFNFFGRDWGARAR